MKTNYNCNSCPSCPPNTTITLLINIIITISIITINITATLLINIIIIILIWNISINLSRPNLSRINSRISILVQMGRTWISYLTTPITIISTSITHQSRISLERSDLFIYMIYTICIKYIIKLILYLYDINKV